MWRNFREAEEEEEEEGEHEDKLNFRLLKHLETRP
jgi:hypothetical protein